MEQLWAPWRMTYISEEIDSNSGSCVFCLGSSTDQDEKRQVVCRGKHAFAIMNRYPYTNGHLLVAPYRHTAEFGSLSADEASEIHRLLVLCQEVLKETMGPHGFNVGMNLGRIAGAGIADHLHAHIVPRWNGDTNFMPVFADVRVIPQHLDETYRLLAKAFEAKQP